MIMFNFTATTAATQQATGAGSFLPMILMWVAIFGVMYLVMFRPQRTRQKEEQKMRENLRVGDEVTTIGGICGRVVSVKDDALVIETGMDRSKITIKKWAIQSCDTIHDEPLDDDDDDDDDDD